MKILMLGHSGVGKTTFMASMYAALQNPVQGFTVGMEDESDHTRLMALADDVWRGRFPAPTAQLSSYDLVLRHLGAPVFEFEWVDYRGGALDEAGGSREMEQLLEELDEADGLIAFFDGPALAAGGRAAREVVGRIMVLIQHAIEADDRIIPAALVVTKADELKEAAPIVEALGPLINAIKASQTVHGSVIFTGCGPGFRLHMEEPTLFVLHKGIHGVLVRLDRQMDGLRNEAASYEQKAGLFDWIESKLNGAYTYGEMAQSRYRALNDLVLAYNRLVDPVNALRGPLADTAMF